jgi:glycosyltransferase involved in cell wall biosynthesis
MKIVQVMAGAAHGGAETAFVDMCIALHEAGHDIVVITRANDLRIPQLQKAGLRVHTLRFGGAIDILTKSRMRRIIMDFKPDIVQTWMARAPWKTPRWNKNMGIPYYPVIARLGGYYNIKYFKAADYFTTITPDIKQYLIDQGIDGKTIEHINNFAETETVTSPIDRMDFGIPKNAPLVLGLGRLHTAKAFDTLIRAVASLEGVYLWIAGEGPERTALEELIRALAVEDRVKLLGWRSDRASLFQASDLCFFSSRYEPFGTVFVQAWAQKTPLITTNADGPRQFVRNEEDGLIVEIDNEPQFKAAILRVLGDPDLAKKLIENGYRRYEAEFTKEKTLSHYLAFYEAILKQRRL